MWSLGSLKKTVRKVFAVAYARKSYVSEFFTIPILDNMVWHLHPANRLEVGKRPADFLRFGFARRCMVKTHTDQEVRVRIERQPSRGVRFDEINAMNSLLTFCLLTEIL